MNNHFTAIDGQARRHLSRRDPILRKVIQFIGPCTLQHNPDGFAVLVHSIISQQISTKAAAAIRTRLGNLLGPKGVTLSGLRKASDPVLRAAGLSAPKVRSLRDLADKVHWGEVALGGLDRLTDEEIIDLLVPVHGIGPWTAQMFLAALPQYCHLVLLAKPGRCAAERVNRFQPSISLIRSTSSH